MGGADKIAKVTSRHITATRIEPDGKTRAGGYLAAGPETPRRHNIRRAEQYHDHRAATTVLTRGESRAAISRSTSAADDRAQLRLASDCCLARISSRSIRNSTIALPIEIDGNPVYVVTATPPNNQVERLAFDVATGLLVRRIYVVRTALGPFLYQWDFSDYKDFGGVKIPTTIKAAQPGVRFTRKITKVKINAPVADTSIFNEPKK